MTVQNQSPPGRKIPMLMDAEAREQLKAEIHRCSSAGDFAGAAAGGGKAGPDG